MVFQVERLAPVYYYSDIPAPTTKKRNIFQLNFPRSPNPVPRLAIKYRTGEDLSDGASIVADIPAACHLNW